ncbi:MFS transporter [bacterium]|nr:MFS transporter [bacterium]
MPGSALTYSKSEINTGLRGFFNWIVFMGGYWQTTLASSPIFIGFVLALGASESTPSNFICFLYLTGLIQIISHLVTNRFKNKKWLVIIFGAMEGLILTLIIVLSMSISRDSLIRIIPLIIMMSAAFSHIVNPLLNAWYGALIPDSIRASYIGRRIMMSQIAGIVSLTVAGKVVDVMSGLNGFYLVFGIGIAMVVAAYFSLSPVRFPAEVSRKPLSFGDIISIAKNDRQFIIFSLCYGAWSIGYYNALPNLNVLLIRQLHLSYSRVAFYQNCQFFFMLVGYALWPRYIQKFGTRPTMSLSLVPLIFIPLIWLTVESFNHQLLIPVMMVYGIGISGVILGASTHLFTIIPKDERSPAYLVCWSVIVFLSMAIGPKLGAGIMEMSEQVRFTVWHFTIMNIKLALIAVSVFYFIAFVLLGRLRGKKPVPATVLVDQIFRHNPISLAYNLFVLEKSTHEEPRADAIEKLGRSGGAMALDSLINSLTDISPVVRRQAASSIGEVMHPEAVGPLARFVRDPESDIRGEAASSLGRIDTPESRKAVWGALSDTNPGVRAAAIQALGNFSGAEVDEKLIDMVKTVKDPVTFTALADTLARRGTLDAVEYILRSREMFASQRIRKQTLNAVAEMLGMVNDFYPMISQGATHAVASLEEYLERTLVLLEKSRSPIVPELIPPVEGMLTAFAGNDTAAFLERSSEFALGIQSKGYEQPRVRASIRAIDTFVRSKTDKRETHFAGKAFLAVCARVIIDEILKERNGK